MSKKVIVIGAGPGGYPAALRLKELGADVTIVEARDFGGACLNRGCIPSKAFLDTGHRVHAFDGLRKLLKDDSGFNFSPAMLDWEKVKARRAEVVSKLRTSLEKLFQAKKIEVIRGKAAFSGPNEVTVTGPQGEVKKFFDAAILAAGTRPGFPPPFRDFQAELTDSDRVFDLPRLPKEMKLHPYGVEYGILLRMLGTTNSKTLSSFLVNEFSSIGTTSAKEVCKLAKLDTNKKPHSMTREEIERLLDSMQKVKIQRPPLDCLSPVGEKDLEKSLR